MKKTFFHIAALFASTAFCGGLDVARQALADGVWRTALTAADEVAASSTNAAERTSARLLSLEALAMLEDDAEIRKRLAGWKDASSDSFRYWKARSLVRVGDFDQARKMLAGPFADPELALPVSCLKAAVAIVSGDHGQALRELSAVEKDPSSVSGLAGEDAKLMVGEALCLDGRRDRAREFLAGLAEGASRKEVRMRAGYLLGFSEMENPSTYTAGVSRVRALLRADPGHGTSGTAAKSLAERLLNAGDAAGAEDEYRRYLEAFPSGAMDAGVAENRARALFGCGRNSEAVGAFARAEQMAAGPEDKARLAYLQGEVHREDGDFAAAAECFGRSAALAGDGAGRSLYARADAFERRADACADDASEHSRCEAMATGIYTNLVAAGGTWGAKSKLRLIAMDARKGRLIDAIEGYTGLLASPDGLSPEDVTEAYLGRGRAYYRDYRFNEASADFAEVASRRPALADGMKFLKALCLYGAGKDAKAKKAAADLMESTKDAGLRADLMLWCARYEYNHGEFSEAQKHFTAYAAARKGSPSAANALLLAARSASAQMEYQKAVELATDAATAAPSGSPLFLEALLVQGEAVMELGRYAEAAQLFDRVSGLAGDTPSARNAAALKADALYAMGAGDMNRYEEAISAYRALLDSGGISPDRRIEASFKIGRALEKLHRTKEAMDQYYRNVVLAYSEETSKGVLLGTPARTFFSRAAFSLADYHAAAGDVRAVRKLLRRIIDSDVPAAKEARRRLGEMDGKGETE